MPSDSVGLAAEAGSLIGVQVMLSDGRYLFVSHANLAGIIDAPAEQDKPSPARRTPGK